VDLEAELAIAELVVAQLDRLGAVDLVAEARSIDPVLGLVNGRCTRRLPRESRDHIGRDVGAARG
jgi:hypothetical protein